MGSDLKPCIVLSGVNFVEGGPLAVFQDALSTLSEHFLDRFDVIALVHRQELFHIPGITYMEFPDIKNSWWARIKFEYRECLSLSRELSPTLWLSMHDMTPKVMAQVQAVYCHNPAPFHELSLREAWLDPTFTLFRLFYQVLYAVNIEENDFVIVQQDWLRQEFQRRFQPRKVVVAHPSIPSAHFDSDERIKEAKDKYVFFYPAFARSFKNFELIFAAARLLEAKSRGFELWVTIDGSENRYASKLRQNFGQMESVRWLGAQSRRSVEELYVAADCLLFPSKLETWGMPISEWKRTRKPMLVADLPYAYETVGDYHDVAFVDPQNADLLMKQMNDLVEKSAALGSSCAQPIAQPFAGNWRELFEILLHHTNGVHHHAGTLPTTLKALQ